MTAGLFAAGVLITLMVAFGIYLMDGAAAVPAARASGEAPDPEEEREVQRRQDQHAPSRIMIERPPGR